MVIKAVTESKVFSSRLHLVDSRDLRSDESEISRRNLRKLPADYLRSEEADCELEPQGAEKTGIRIANWFQRKFGKSTEVQIGNKTYHLNTKSLKKYLVRTAIGRSITRNSDAVHSAAMGAFSVISKDMGQPHATSPAAQKGLLLERHAQITQIGRSSERAQAVVQIPSIGDFTLHQRKTSHQDVWEDLFDKEVGAFNAIKSAQAASVQSQKPGATLMPKFETALDTLVASKTLYRFTETDRSRILNFARSLSDVHIEEFTKQIETSVQLLQATKPYIELKRQENKLSQKLKLLDGELATHDRRKTARELDDVGFQIIHNVVYKSSDSDTPVIALTLIPEVTIAPLDNTEPALATKLRAYNRTLKEFQKAYNANELLCEQYEGNLVSLGEQIGDYARHKVTLKEHFNAGSDVEIKLSGLTLDQFIDQHKHLGIYRLREEIQKHKSAIEKQTRLIAEPEAQYAIDEAQQKISELKAELKILNTSFSTDEKARIIADLNENLEQSEAKKAEILASHVDQEMGPRAEAQLRNLNERIIDLESQKALYAEEGKASAVGRVKRMIVGLEAELTFHKSSKVIEVKESRAKLTQHKKIAARLSSFLASKEKAFVAKAKIFAKAEGLKLTADVEKSVFVHIRGKLDACKSEVYRLTRSKDQLREEQERSHENFKTAASKLLKDITRVRPVLLTEEDHEQLTLSHLQTRKELKATRDQIHAFNTDEALSGLIRSGLGAQAPICQAYASARVAQIANLNFLFLAIDQQGASIDRVYQAKRETDRELESLEEGLSRADISLNLKSDFSQVLVFEGATKSIASKMVGSRSLESQRLQAKTGFDEFMRDSTSSARARSRAGSLLGDADSAIDSDSMSRARAYTGSSDEFSELSFVSRSSGGDSGYVASAGPRSPQDELTRINPIFQKLWVEVGSRSSRSPKGTPNPGQNFIGELDGFDAKYFSHSDEKKRLVSGQSLPFLNEHTGPLLELFVNGHEMTSVHFNYNVMSKFVHDRGFAIASIIKDESHGMSENEKYLYILGTILIKGLERDPEKERAFKAALDSLSPGTKDFFVERGLLSA